MKLKIMLTAILAISLGLSSCKKRGDFTTDKSEYTQGEVITVTNTTKKASTYYKWTFGTDEIIGENPVYTIPEETPVGSFTITVLPVNSLNTTANSKEYSRTVNIIEAEKAKVIFFLPEPYFGSGSATDETCTITFTDLDGNNSSKTVSIDPTVPDCESNNNLSAATFDNLPAGNYSFELDGSSSSSSYNLSGLTVSLEDGFDCRIIDISKQ